MKKKKIKYIELPAGSIVLWQEHSVLKEIFCKLFNKKLSYNRILVVGEPTEYCFIDNVTSVKFYTPIRTYNSREKTLLKKLMNGCKETWDNLLKIVNRVRRNTFDDIPSKIDITYIDNNNYYRLINVDKESKEYIYSIK